MLKSPSGFFFMVTILLGFAAPGHADPELVAAAAEPSAGAPAAVDESQPVAPPPQRNILDSLKLKTDFQQTAALFTLLADADLEELDRFVDQAKSIADLEDKKAGLQLIYLRFLDLDPEAAVEHALTSGTGQEGEILYSLFFSWAKLDTDAAVRKSKALNIPRHQQMAAMAIVRANHARGMNELKALAQGLGPVAMQQVQNLETEQLVELANHDPKAAFELALASDAMARGGMVQQVAQRWAARDPMAVLAFSETIESPLHKSVLRSAALSGLAENDPVAALAELEDGSYSQQERYVMMSSAVQSLVKTDPYDALLRVNAIKRDGERHQALSQLMMFTSITSPDQAFDLLRTFDDPEMVEQLGRQAIGQLARVDPDKALEFGREFRATAPGLEMQALEMIAHSDPGRVLELVKDMPSSADKNRLMTQLVQSLAQTDPIRAVTIAEDLPQGPGRQQALVGIANMWFSQDPETALAWVFSLNVQPQAQVLENLASEVVEFDIEYAKSLLPMLPSHYVRNRWISSIVYNSAVNGSPQQTAQWLKAYQDHPEFGNWMTHIIQASASKNRISDALNIVETIEDPAIYDQALGALLTFWSAKAPEQAANWLSSANDLPNRGQMINDVAAQWANQDLKSVTQWLMRLKDSGERDSGLATLMNNENLTTQDADFVVRKIVSPEIRFNALRNYLSNLARYDTQAAELYLQRQTMLSHEKDVLMDAIRNAGSQAGRSYRTTN